MGIFSKLKGAMTSKANAALDSAIDPAKELELKIFELETGRKKALQELLSYRATTKTMEQEMAAKAERAAKLEQRAMQAVRAGDDDLARRCLKEKKDLDAEHARIARDRDEIAGHAIQLNNSRKTLETKLQILKLKKGTLATQLAAARSGGGALGDDELFDRFAAAEEKIDDDEAAAGAEGELAAGADDGALERALLEAERAHGAAPTTAEGGDALDALKGKMEAERAARAAGKLKP